MDRKSFFEKIYKTYSGFFKNEEHLNTWLENYRLVMPLNYDYTELYKVVIKEHTDANKPPTPAWLCTKRLELIKSNSKQETEDYKSNECVEFKDLPEEAKKAWKELTKKLNQRSSLLNN